MGERLVNGSPRGWFRKAGYLALAGAVSLSAALVPSPSSAVVGGSPTDISRHPWQVLVISEPDNRLCGGAIIAQGWVATAAHCVSGATADSIDVHVGITLLSERAAANRVELSEVIVHPEWDSTNYRNDLALLRLATPVKFGPTVTAVSLPLGQDSSTWPASGTPATITGWGATVFDGEPSNHLRSAQVQILGGPTDATCGLYGGSFDADVELCVGVPGGGVDSCQGDSGSPLVIDVSGKPVLAGVTSVGFECALADYPGIFTRMTSFSTWVQSYLPQSDVPIDAPQNVRVEAIAGERLLVSWEPPMVAPLPISYRAVADPGGASCDSSGEVFTCLMDGVRAGRLYEVSVSAMSPTAQETTAPVVRAVAVDGVASVGVRVKPKRLAVWAGLRVRAGDKVQLTVRPPSIGVCRRIGTRNNPQSVRMLTEGLCAVRVVVVRPDGRRKSALAYVNSR